MVTSRPRTEGGRRGHGVPGLAARLLVVAAAAAVGLWLPAVPLAFLVAAAAGLGATWSP